VFDLVFAEGIEAMFRFSLALMKKSEKVVCELDFEQLLDFLKSGLFEAYRVSFFPIDALS
jgi:ecotropic viral integration site 5 protein